MIAILLFLVSFCIFLNFQTIGIVGVDSGDMVTAAVLGGVAHPPGYPLYTFLGSLLAKIPLYTPAWRVGLLSSVPQAITIALVFIIVRYITHKTFPALFAALAILGNYILFLYGVVSEVFALHNAFLTVLIFLSLKWLERPSKKIFILTVFVFGLSLTHHHLIFLFLPALLYIWFEKRKVLQPTWIFPAVIAFIIGFIPYSYIYFASQRLTMINWGSVHDVQSFIALVLRSQYGTFFSSSIFGTSVIERLLNVKSFFTVFATDITWFGIILSLIGIITLFRQKRSYGIFFILLFLFTGPIFYFYASFPIVNYFSAAVVERFMMQSYLVAYILIGIGISHIYNFIDHRRNIHQSYSLAFLWYGVCGLFVALTIMTQILRFWGFHSDTTGDFLGIDTLDTMPKNSILFLSGDTHIFITQYVRYALKYRDDVALLSLNVLTDPSMLKPVALNFPDLVLPDTKTQSITRLFIDQNIHKRQIYSNVRLEIQGYVAMPYGLLYKIVPIDALPSETDYMIDIKKLWDSYHLYEIKNGIMKRYRHLVLIDVSSKYSEKMTEFASVLTALNRYEEAIVYADKAIDIGGDFGLPQAYAVKGMAFYGLHDCKQSTKNLEIAVDYNPAFDEDVAKNLLFVYKECKGDTNKSSLLQARYDHYLRQKGVSLENL